MKKLILALFIFLVVLPFACLPRHSKIEKPEVVKVKETNSSFTIYKTEFIIDGCEYLIFEIYNGYTMAVHKGNCKNPIHQHDKQQ